MRLQISVHFIKRDKLSRTLKQINTDEEQKLSEDNGKNCMGSYD